MSSWEQVGALRRIGYLAGNLDPAEYEFEIVALQARGPHPQSIMAVPLPSTALAAGKRLALPLAWRLRLHTRMSQSDTVHAWDRTAFRVARMALTGRRHNTRIVCTTAHELPPAIDLVQVQREAHRGPSREKLLAELTIPADSRLLGTAGHLTDSKEIIDLLWGLDQIRCVRRMYYLLVVGDGMPGRLSNAMRGCTKSKITCISWAGRATPPRFWHRSMCTVQRAFKSRARWPCSKRWPSASRS